MSKDLLHAQCYINGEWVEGKGALKEVHSPIDGKVIGTFREASPEQVDDAVKCAKEAQKLWKQTSLMERVELLEKAYKIGLKNMPMIWPGI